MPLATTCSAESRAANERLAGSFKPADTFFLIQSELAGYGGWAHETVKRAQAEGDFAPYLRHLMSVGRAKALFIRRPATKGKNFYIASTNQPRPRIFHTELRDYDELLSLDLESVGDGKTPRISGRDMDEIDELYTVCANGRHDPCCALHGTPVYKALVEGAGVDKVWQTTHIGGHRLAATMIAFPQGIVYGHLDAEDAEAIIMNHRAGFLLTHKYRGRGAYAGHALDGDTHQAVGAAEGFIREAARLYADSDLRLNDVAALDDGRWRINFVDSSLAERAAEVKMTMSAPQPTSCGDPAKPMPQHAVELLAV